MKLKDALKEEFKDYGKEILGKVKQKALELLEDEVEGVLEKLEKAVAKSSDKTDDLYLLVSGPIKKMADKIDGKEG